MTTFELLIGFPLRYFQVLLPVGLALWGLGLLGRYLRRFYDR